MAYPNLRAEMARLGISAEKLAKALGIHVTTLHSKLRGEYEFSLSMAKQIKKILCYDGTVEELFKRADE